MRALTGHDPKIIDLLSALGVSRPEECVRVIVDLKADDIARIYVQRLATTINPEAIKRLDVVLDIVELDE